MANGLPDVTTGGGHRGTIVTVVTIIVAIIAIIMAWRAPSGDDMQTAINKTLKPALVSKADSAGTYAALNNKANASDLQTLQGQVAALTGRVYEVRNEVFGYATADTADIDTNDVVTYKATYHAGLSDLVRGWRDTVRVETPDGDIVSVFVRFAAMPSGAELQQAVNHDLPRAMAAAARTDGVPTPEATAFFTDYRRRVSLGTSRAESDRLYLEATQNAKK